MILLVFALALLAVIWYMLSFRSVQDRPSAGSSWFYLELWLEFDILGPGLFLFKNLLYKTIQRDLIPHKQKSPPQSPPRGIGGAGIGGHAFKKSYKVLTVSAEIPVMSTMYSTQNPFAFMRLAELLFSWSTPLLSKKESVLCLI